MDFEMKRNKLFLIDHNMIFLVQLNPLIYDTKQVDYSDHLKRENIFNNVAIQLKKNYNHWKNISSKTVQKRWNHLKETFTRAHLCYMDEQKFTSMQSEVFKCMQFFAKFTTHRRETVKKVYDYVSNEEDNLELAVEQQSIVNENNMGNDTTVTEHGTEHFNEVETVTHPLTSMKNKLFQFLGENQFNDEELEDNNFVQTLQESETTETTTESTHAAFKLFENNNETLNRVINDAEVFEVDESDTDPLKLDSLVVPDADTVKSYFNNKFSDKKAKDKTSQMSLLKDSMKELQKTANNLKYNQMVVSRAEIISNVLKSLPPQKIGVAYLKIIELTS